MRRPGCSGWNENEPADPCRILGHDWVLVTCGDGSTLWVCDEPECDEEEEP